MHNEMSPRDHSHMQTTILTAERAESADPTISPGPLTLTVLEWSLYVIMFILPLDVYLTLPGQSSGVFLSEVLVLESSLLLGGIVAVAWLRRQALPVTLSWRDVLPIGLIIIVGLIATLTAAHKAVAARECAKYAFFLGVFLIARAVSHRPGVRRKALISLLSGFACVTTIGIIASMIPSLPDFAGLLLNIQRVPSYLPGSARLRAAATFRFSDELESYLLLILPFCAVCVVKFHQWEERLLSATLGLLGIWLLLLTYTRTAYVILPIVACLLIFFLSGRRIGRIVLWLGVLGACSFVLLFFFSATSARFFSIFTSSGLGNRDAIWNWVLSGVAHHPLFGLGPRNLQYLPGAPLADPYHHRVETNAENSYLNVLADMGLVGLAVVTSTLTMGVLHVIRAVRRATPRIDFIWNLGTLGGFVALLLDALVHPTFSSGQVTGLLCALVGLVIIAPETKTSHEAAITSARDMSQQVTQELPHVARRTVFLVNAPGFGGANQHALNIASGMQAAGTDVLIVAPPGSATLSRAEARGLPVRGMQLGTNIGRGRGVLGVIAFMNPFGRHRSQRMIRLLADEAPSIFVCPFPREQIITARMHDIKTIWVVHAPLRYVAHRLFILRAWQHAARRAAGVVAVSAKLGAILKKEGIPPSRLHIIPNSVDIPSAEAATPDNRVPLLIGTASRLVKDKGIQYMIAAMPDIVARFPQAHLAIAGSGPYEPQLRALVQRLRMQDHVEFVGYLADPTPFLSSLHVFVHPTVDPGEVLPTIILEAASLGTPVVASNLASIPDEVVDGQTGFLTPPGDTIAIAASVNTLLADPVSARAMGAAGRSLVMHQFPLDRAVAGFLALCRASSKVDTSSGSISLIITTPRAAIQRKALFSNSAVVLLSKVLTALATATWTVLAARTLLPADYGNLALASSLVDLFAFLSDFGINSVATRELATSSPPQVPRLLGTIAYLKFFLGIIGSGIVIGITALLPFHAGVFRVMLVLGPSLLFTSIYSLTLIFRARARFNQLLLVSLVVSLIGIGSASVVAFFNGDVIAFASVETVTQICAGLLTLVLCLILFRPDLRLHWRDLGRLSVVAVPVGIALAINILYYRIDVPLLGLLASSEEVAKYSSTYRFLDVLTLLPASLSAATLPQMATLRKRDIGELREFAQQYLEIAASLGLFIGLLLSFSAHPLLDLLYARRYDAATPILQVLAWAGAATLITNVVVPLAVTLNKTRGLFVASVIGLIVNVSINVALIPRFGSLASAYATLITEGVVILCLGWIVVRSLGWRIRLARLGGIAAVTALVAWGSQFAIIQGLAWPIGSAIVAAAWLILAAPLLLIKRTNIAAFLKP